MKSGIHPKYYPNAKVTCACGTVFMAGSTQPELRVDICAHCHPFYTGEQRIVDTAGQVERFMRRLERREELKTAPTPAPAPEPAKAKRKPGTRAAASAKKPAAPKVKEAPAES